MDRANPEETAVNADQAVAKEQEQIEKPDEPTGDMKPLLAGNRKATMVNYSGLPSAGVADDGLDDALLDKTPNGHYPHLDIWRGMCIAVVVLDHGNWHYSDVNLLFGQNWTLQFIFTICGICFGLSSKGISGYLLRLICYVLLGVSFNLVAKIFVGQEWRKDPWNVVFQFWFVVALIGYSIILLPMKGYLARCRDQAKENQDSAPGDAESGVAPVSKAGPSGREVATGVTVVFGGLLVIFFALSAGLARLLAGTMGDEFQAAVSRLGPGLSFWMGDPAQVLRCTVAAVELSVSNVWLALMVPAMFPTQMSLTGWAILINMHARRLSTWYSGIGEKMMNGLDLMLLGLVCYYLGLKFRRPIGKKMARYWFVWLAICGLVWKPGTHGRLDLLMPEEWAFRWRMQVIDTVFIILFLTAGDLTVDSRIFTEDKCQFINNLGLFLFLVHKAIHIIFPEPWNWFVILSWIPIFWYIYKPKDSPLPAGACQASS